MDTRARSSLAGGLALILLGVVFLIAQVMPEQFAWLDPEKNWPLIIIGVGVLLFVIGLLSGAPAMAVPACIVGGIGGILYVQNATDNWASWSYAWTLIPGFVGVGVLLSGLLSGRGSKAIQEGGGSILVSMVLFAIFGSLFGAADFVIPIWPIMLIAVGVIMLIRAIVRPR
jgi:hypothetical protein